MSDSLLLAIQITTGEEGRVMSDSFMLKCLCDILKVMTCCM